MMFLAVSGMVGVGKTTLATVLAKRLGYALISERGSTNPYLDDYYADFQRWSFNVQVFFLAERFRGQLRVLRERTPHVQDRTIYEDAEIFARLHYEQGNMDTRDYATYRLLYETLLDTPAFPHPNPVLYLTGDFEEIYQRIRTRGRPAELKTPRSYWWELYLRYEAWIADFRRAPVLRVPIASYDAYEGRGIDDLVEQIRALGVG